MHGGFHESLKMAFRRDHLTQQVTIARVGAEGIKIRLRIYACKARITFGQGSLQKLKHSVRLSESSVVNCKTERRYIMLRASLPEFLHQFVGVVLVTRPSVRRCQEGSRQTEGRRKLCVFSTLAIACCSEPF